jgi:hypothetical protein
MGRLDCQERRLTMLTKEDIPAYAPETIELGDGSTVKIEVIRDEDMGPPWDEVDGYGEVIGWTADPKDPGWMVLAKDGRSRLYYNFQGAVEKARREEWGAEGKTARERAARAAMEDFRRMRAWCDNEWEWVGVVVTLTRPDGSEVRDSLWGIESDGDCWREVAAELINGNLRSA